MDQQLTLRAAEVHGHMYGKGHTDDVQALTPDNYAVVHTPGKTWIVGSDVMGWTLDGYVIPRLASGGIIAVECSPAVSHPPTAAKLAEHGIRPQDGDPKPERTFAEADRDRATA